MLSMRPCTCIGPLALALIVVSLFSGECRLREVIWLGASSQRDYASTTCGSATALVWLPECPCKSWTVGIGLTARSYRGCDCGTALSFALWAGHICLLGVLRRLGGCPLLPRKELAWFAASNSAGCFWGLCGLRPFGCPPVRASGGSTP